MLLPDRFWHASEYKLKYCDLFLNVIIVRIPHAIHRKKMRTIILFFKHYNIVVDRDNNTLTSNKTRPFRQSGVTWGLYSDYNNRYIVTNKLRHR